MTEALEATVAQPLSDENLAARANMLASVRDFVSKIERGEIVSFVGLGRSADGEDVEVIAVCDPAWARQAMTAMLSQLPPVQ